MSRGLVLLALGVLLVGAIVGVGQAVVADSQTVTVTDNQSQDVVVDIELLDDPAAQNATVALIANSTDSTVSERELNGSADEWTTETFAVSSDGDYIVNVSADNSTAIGNVTAEAVEESSGGLLAPIEDTPDSTLLLGAIGLAVTVYAIRER